MNSFGQNNQSPAVSQQNLQSTGADIYWSENEKVLYRKIGEKLILHSRDRRKKKGVGPNGVERRQKKAS